MPVRSQIATKNEVDAYGYKWDWAGRSTKHIPFVWSSEDELYNGGKAFKICARD